jgi:hypothetical protein
MIYSLDSAKSSRLVSDALGKFFPLTEYWKLYRTDIYRIHRAPTYSNFDESAWNHISYRHCLICWYTMDPINVSTPAICSTIYSLDSAKSSRLVSDALGKFFPLTEYWYRHCLICWYTMDPINVSTV